MTRRHVAVWAVVLGVVLALASEVEGQSTTTVEQEIRVPPGETMVLPAAQNLSWYLDTLVMGDGATLQIAPETKVFLLRAHEAEIGVGARIVGAGLVGSAGAPGFDQHGGETLRGGDGHPAGIGGVGPTIVLIIQDRAEIGTLTASAIGGKGGTGGLGGVGSPSHRGRCGGRGAIDSGDAGNGGKGGSGGRGGTVLLLLPESAREQPGRARTINAIAEGGPGGDGGGGRSARPGAGPHDCVFGGRGGSASGRSGSPGPAGDGPGPSGTTEIRFVDFAALEPDPVVTIDERLQRLMEMLRDNGYEGNADALEAVLQTSALNPSLRWRQ